MPTSTSPKCRSMSSTMTEERERGQARGERDPVRRASLDAYVSLGKGEELRATAEGRGGPCTQRMGRKLRTDEGRRRVKTPKRGVDPALRAVKPGLRLPGLLLGGLAPGEGRGGTRHCPPPL